MFGEINGFFKLNINCCNRNVFFDVNMGRGVFAFNNIMIRAVDNRSYNSSHSCMHSIFFVNWSENVMLLTSIADDCGCLFFDFCVK